MLMQFAPEGGCSTGDGYFWPVVQEYWCWMRCTTWQFVSTYHTDPFAVTYSALHQYRFLPLNFPALQFLTIRNLQLVQNHFNNVFSIPNNLTTVCVFSAYMTCHCHKFHRHLSCTNLEVVQKAVMSAPLSSSSRTMSARLHLVSSAAVVQLGCSVLAQHMADCQLLCESQAQLQCSAATP